MNRRQFLLGLTTAVALMATTGAVLASSYSEDIVAQLVKLGFSDIRAETTLLGRVRIVANRADGVREIVLNPRTGEILRDTWIPATGGAAPRTVISDIDHDDDNSGSGSDDHDDEDNSGSGSGSGDDDNSGHGSGGDDRDDDRDRDEKDD